MVKVKVHQHSCPAYLEAKPQNGGGHKVEGGKSQQANSLMVEKI
jgi:hypothetical protein